MSVSASNEFAGIMNDGAFAKRMKDFSEAKEQAQEALTALDLGRRARDAYGDAKAKQEEAERVLDAARKQADEIIRTAKSAADKMRSDAEGHLQDSRRLKEASAKLHENANRHLEEAERTRRLVQAEKVAHVDATELARKAEAKFTDLVAKIHAVING